MGGSAGMQPNPLRLLAPPPPPPPMSSTIHPPNDSPSFLYNPMIPAVITEARHKRKTPTDTHNTHVHTQFCAERCWRYCTQDEKCWPMSRGGLYHFPVAFYFNTGKSSGAPTVPALPLPLFGTSAPPAAH